MPDKQSEWQKMIRSNKFIILGIVSVLALLGGVGIFILNIGDSVSLTSTNTSNTVFTKKPAPDFEIELFSGNNVKLSDFKGKKPVVVNFWASWCGPCRAEGNALAKIGSEYKDKVEFIGIATNDNQNDAEAFLKEFGITYKNGLDKTAIAANYNIKGIPTTFFIDTEGNIIDYWVGPIDRQGIIDRIDKLL